MRVLLLEGIVGAGKSTVLEALRAKLAGRRGALWVLPEHFTERVLEPLATAAPAAALAHLSAVVTAIEQFAGWWRAAPAGAEAWVVLERFHLSVAVDVAGVRWADCRRLEDRLRAVGEVRLAWFVVRPSRLLEQTVRDPVGRRPVAWRRYLATLGADDDARVAHFRRRQLAFARHFRASRLAKTRLEWKPGIETSLADRLVSGLWAEVPLG